jgi:ferric-dicitrate binding protein FerR (iron transport regulator)
MTEDDADAPRPAPPPTRRRLLPLLLVVAGGICVALLSPHAPRSRSVDFRIEEDHASVVRLDVTWSRVHGDKKGASKPDTVAGGSYRFEPGTAPKIIRTNVRLPNGTYALDITLERADHSASIQRTVTLGDSDQITIPLR